MRALDAEHVQPVTEHLLGKPPARAAELEHRQLIPSVDRLAHRDESCHQAFDDRLGHVLKIAEIGIGIEAVEVKQAERMGKALIEPPKRIGADAAMVEFALVDLNELGGHGIPALLRRLMRREIMLPGATWKYNKQKK